MRSTRSLVSLVTVLAALSLLLSLAVDANSQTPGQSSPAADVIHGDVLNIEGDTYTIKDVTGHEVYLKVDGQTQHEDRIKVGDKVEAQVSADGHAVTIRIAIPNDMPRHSSP